MSDIKNHNEKNPKILLMDDEEIIRDNMEEIGDILNIDMVTTKNAEEAVEKFAKAMMNNEKFDAVILDLTIKGGAGGCEALKELKQMDPDIKSILFSGDDFSEISQNYTRYGFYDIIKKPVNIQEFANKINNVLLGKI